MLFLIRLGQYKLGLNVLSNLYRLLIRHLPLMHSLSISLVLTWFSVWEEFYIALGLLRTNWVTWVNFCYLTRINIILRAAGDSLVFFYVMNGALIVFFFSSSCLVRTFTLEFWILIHERCWVIDVSWAWLVNLSIL